MVSGFFFGGSLVVYLSWCKSVSGWVAAQKERNVLRQVSREGCGEAPELMSHVAHELAQEDLPRKYRPMVQGRILAGAPGPAQGKRLGFRV
jgi:hypothetical protein